VTGRKALYVNPSFTTHIVGLERDESAARLRFLYRHQQHAAFQCRFRWRPGSLAIWDNRCTQHLAMWDYYPDVRDG
jgi:alpha-ketoglutarate-dependent taurine dioxygenase